MPRRFTFALAGLALLWAAALLVAPLLPTAMAAALYAAGSLICHQMPERSFHVDGFQLPVCGRCLGLYLGGVMGASAGAVAPQRHRLTSAARRFAVTAALAVPTLTTLVLEHALGWPLSNTTRALSAVPLAAAIAFVVTGGAPTLHYGECTPRRPIAHGQIPPPAST